ncbi:hypothetical protein EIN_429660 [Entamoeba invadens IP1]|uniref:Uncharacterized protein n=1 Tax=Entamoeba invadens IP1 TaxID=370355 RepID=A0A0A1UF22_ENTIV|nr:hypothetical protein EIN_429660 [Entamoeba invadens IP1]ELP95190.1 hypothetical protein EIN_429660 [Entamoeba invadens IP1]|eukprot:XP_004261961.1 hypothetical protein EIN_429660 [Entamoeba invadens IP1]
MDTETKANSTETFRYDWNFGVVRITKSVRVTVTIILWIITFLLSLTSFILSLTIENMWVIYVLYITALIPSFLSYIFVYGCNPKVCCISPHAGFAIAFHVICIVCVTFTLIIIGVPQPTTVVIIIQSLYIFSETIHLPFIKPHADRFLSWLLN